MSINSFLCHNIAGVTHSISDELLFRSTTPTIMAANPFAGATVSRLLQEIGVAPDHRRAHFTSVYDDDVVEFVKSYSFSGGHKELETMQGVEYNVGATQYTFRTNMPQRKRIQGFALWATTCIAQGVTPDVAEYLNAGQAEHRAWINQAQMLHDQRKSKTDTGSRMEDVTVNVEKGMLKNLLTWENTKRAIRQALSHIKTGNGIGSLVYLTRRELRNKPHQHHLWIRDANQPWTGDFDKYMEATLAIHYPPEVTIPEQRPMWEDTRARVTNDSHRLWALIEHVVNGQPTWDLVRQFQDTKDGIGAWRRLVQEAEGSTARLSKKKHARDTINSTIFTGRSSRFTFSAYVAKLEGAFAILAEEEEAVPESLKVQHLLDNCKDPLLLAAKDHIFGEGELFGSFNAASQYLGTVLRNKQGSASSSGMRSVSQVESGDGAESSEQAEARKKKTPSGVKWQDGRFLPRKEYRKLWNWEREEHAKIVANLPKDKKGRGNRKRKGGGANKPGKERKVSQVESEPSEDGTETVPDTNAAGDQFGRQAHANSKKAVTIKEDAKPAKSNNDGKTA